MKKFIAYLLTFVIGAGAGAGGLIMYAGQDKVITAQENTVTTEEVTIDADVIRDEFADVGEMVTQDYDYTSLQTYQSSLFVSKYNIKLPFSDSSFTMSYDGTIKAGIDFTRIDVDVDEDTKTVTLTLPQAYIISSEIDNDSFRVLDEKSSILNKISLDDFNYAQDDLKAQAESEAIEKGLLTKAQNNAKTVVKVFISSLPNIENYSVVIMTGDAE